MMLKDKLGERFEYFKSIAIKNVKGPILLLKKKEMVAELCKVKYLSDDYLTILL